MILANYHGCHFHLKKKYIPLQQRPKALSLKQTKSRYWILNFWGIQQLDQDGTVRHVLPLD